ncbi:MAG TPA: DUF4198 domain-containing protein [Burkholderiaceae bacterium]|jgi:uncharacterized GH25 family protein
MRLISIWIGAVVALIFGVSADAHEFWLVPHEAEAKTGDAVVFELRIGPNWPGVQTARLPHLVASFEAHDAVGTMSVEGRDGTLAVGHLRTRAAGATLVALRTNPARLELSGAEFNQYLQEEGLNEVLALRQRHGLLDTPGRESFSRCAKSIILVDQNSRGYGRVVGLPLELVPLTDPLGFIVSGNGGKFAVQLIFNGQPLAGALVKAQLKADPPVELSAVSDQNGKVFFALPRKGLWLFNAVHMLPAQDSSVDWESLWASLTLSVPR